jgi:hypothetical protein
VSVSKSWQNLMNYGNVSDTSIARYLSSSGDLVHANLIDDDDAGTRVRLR